MFSSISRLWYSNSAERSSKYGDPFTGVTTAPLVCDLENMQDTRTRRLRHLLKLNYSEYAVINYVTQRADLIPDVLIAAYDIGLSETDLDAILESTIRSATKWRDSPRALSEQDWMEHIGLTDYQRAFVDYFEDQLAESAYDWRTVVDEHLFTGDRPLFGHCFANLGAPLIRLASALKVDSRELGMESLVLFAASPQKSNGSLLESDTSLAQEPRERPESLYEILDHARIADRHTLSETKVSLSRLIAPGSLNGQVTEDLLSEMELLTISLVHAGPNQAKSFGWLLSTAHALRVVLPIVPSGQIRLAIKEWLHYFLEEFERAGFPQMLVWPGTSKPADSDNWIEIRDLISQRCTVINTETVRMLHCIKTRFAKSETPAGLSSAARALLEG